MKKSSAPQKRPRGPPPVGNNGEPQVPPTLPHRTISYGAGSNTNSSTSEARPHGQPAVSSNPGEPLSGGAEMMDALSDIQVQAPPSGTWGSRPPRRDFAAELREKIMQARLQEAATAAQPAASSDAKRPRSESGPTAEPKRLKMIEGPNRPGPKNFQDIWQLREPRKCYVRLDYSDDSIIGSTSKTNIGYDVRVMLDGGQYGEPLVSLEIRINTTGIDLGKDKYDKVCTVTWEPGVKVNGQWMMDNAAWVSPRKLDDEQEDPVHQVASHLIEFPAVVRENLKSKFEKENIIGFKFQSNVPKSTAWDPRWADSLPREVAGRVKSTMTELLNERLTSAQVDIFFVSAGSGERLIGLHILDYLVDATEQHLPPFVQYMNEEMKPILDYSLPTVEGIGEGMYVNYPTKTLPTGKKVKDLAGKKVYHNFDLRCNWNRISSFAVMQGVPVVREMHHARGLHAPLEKAWHRIFLQTLPMFQADGRAFGPVSA